MSTKFKRPEVQTLMEGYVGCKDLSTWRNFQDDLVNFSISAGRYDVLHAALKRDSAGFLVKGLLTLLEAVASIEAGAYSWAIVRLYYSVFYLHRASMGAKGYALIRNKNWLILKVAPGEKPSLKKGDKFRNDHDAVVNSYIELYGGGDFLQSNTIDGVNSYAWLGDRRNQVNYHQVSFTDPDPPTFVGEWVSIAQKSSVRSVLASYTSGDGLKIFQPEHAWVAIPFLRAKAAIKDFANAKIRVPLESSQFTHIFDEMGGSALFHEDSLAEVFTSEPNE